jgi:hypothetical protein
VRKILYQLFFEERTGSAPLGMQGKALNLVLNCVELRTNHEPYLVQGMVQG